MRCAILLLVALAACDAEIPPSPRQASAPDVPPHPYREEFLGTWAAGPSPRFFIEQGPDGRVTVRVPQGPSRQVVINNVRWSDQALRFDEYGYSDLKENPSVINPTGEDPTNGRLTVMTLEPTDDPDRLKWIKEYHDPAFIATETAELVRADEE